VRRICPSEAIPSSTWAFPLLRCADGHHVPITKLALDLTLGSQLRTTGAAANVPWREKPPAALAIRRLHTSAERTDSDLALAIVNALKWDTAVSTDKLEVAVSRGFVTLKGQVDHYFQREAAERVVQRLAGVKVVNNMITVASHPAPADIKRRIERALIRNAELDAKTISVSVKGNIATLTGTVGSYAEKVAAGRTAWLAPGIATVENHIVIDYGK
jgi:osmotically-inducible protein OsmY